ncbi:MAG TPA: alpha/beta fold hydrolase [Zeimonas sp.]|nr:alpha/beta fold hydrolase [Zeimonas sp.]
MKASIREQAMLLGPRRTLVGILAQAASSPPDAERPMVLILNSGIIHRVGANRLSVALARELAAAGFPVLRFDLSGIGDSEPRADGLAPLDAAMADIREVLGSLEAIRGTRRVVLAGLCSGADHAAIFSASDSRVVGLVLLDPSIPKTRGYYLRYYGMRLGRPGTLLNVLRGRHPMWFWMKTRMAGAPRPPPESFEPDLQSAEIRAYLEGVYRSSVERGVQFLAVFTAGHERIHNYREQLLDAFPGVRFGERLRLEYFGDSDHTFTPGVARERLVRLVVDWASGANFPTARGPDGAEPSSEARARASAIPASRPATP